MVDALEDASLVEEALVMTDSCDIVVKVLVAVGLMDCGGVVSALLTLLTVLGAFEREGVAELSGKVDSVVAELVGAFEPLDESPVWDCEGSDVVGAADVGPADVGPVVSESLPLVVVAPGVSDGPAVV